MKDIDRNLVAVIEKMGQIERSLMWDVATRERLSPVQMQILAFLDRNPRALCRVGFLSREFDLSKATVSDAVRSLEKKKLVSRRSGTVDRRSHTLQLTAGGRRAASRISHWKDALLEHLEGFPIQDKSRILLFFMELVKSLLEDGVISVARMCTTCENFTRDANPGTRAPHRCAFTGADLPVEHLNFGCEHFEGGRHAD